MFPTAPLALTEEQWKHLTRPREFDQFTVSGADDVDLLLGHVLDTLGYLPAEHPLLFPPIRDMAVYDATHGGGRAFVVAITVDAVTVTTERIHLDGFADVNHTPGTPVMRAVLTQILSSLNQALAGLARWAAGCSLATYAEQHLGLTAAALEETVHDTAVDHALTVTQGGLAAQIDYLIRHLGVDNTRRVLEALHLGGSTAVAADAVTAVPQPA
ncbi:hypothetical protein [Nonomuraea sp. NPDC049400]|uniref:hypothetical protein n=1 Tax=Nonomuraea sp. NPDC049400 TaxID=3364352 RepID=UPI00379BDF34